MFDTVVLKPLIKNISNNADLTIQEPSFDFRTKTKSDEIILFEDGKKCITGAKAYCNNEHFNLTIKKNLNPYAKTNTVQLLQFSLPKQKNANNTETVCADKFNVYLEQLYKNVYNAGFEIDLENSQVVRFDTAQNVNTLINSKQFVNVFQFLDIPRMKKQVWESSLLYYNKETELNVYDKPREQGFIAKNQFSSVCRFEMRNKTSKTCREKHGVFCFINLKEKYESIKSNYINYVQSKFFDSLKSEAIIFSYDFSAILDYFKQNSKRNFIQNATNYFSFLYLKENGFLPDYSAALKRYDVSRNNISKIHKRFSKFEIIKKQFDSLKQRKNYFEYIEDLRKEFLKVS